MTTSSYAVLGLLSIRPWSAYELARQAARSLRFAWPKSERHLYTEPKKLVAIGYATASTEPSGAKRSRTVYEITDDGRHALEEWATRAPSPPVFESEAMLRLLFAEVGSLGDLTAALRRLASDADELRQWSSEIVAGYVSGDDLPFPDRVAQNTLLASFQLELFALIERWVDFAAAEVGEWGTPSSPEAQSRALGLAAELARGELPLDRRSGVDSRATDRSSSR